MTPDRTEVVKAFRQLLNNASFGLGQVNDNELETWLFCPGSDRLHLLQWCLGQLNPDLRKRFQACDDIEAEKRTVEHIKTFGVSNDQNVILGNADPKAQIAMWNCMLLVIENSSSCEENSEWVPLKQIENAAVRSKEFTDLLFPKIKLVPNDMRLTPSAVSEKKIEQELVIIQQKLENLRGTADVSSADCDNDDSSILEHSVHDTDDYEEAFHNDLKKIQECYQHLEKYVFPAIRKYPENPIAHVLESYMENLADSVIGFVQMLKDIEAIHKVSGELQKPSAGSGKALDRAELNQCISKCHSCVSEILSMWRLHNMT